MLGDGIEQIERADHVVGLRIHRMTTVDHRIGRTALLAEVHHGIGREAFEDRLKKRIITQVTHKQFNPFVADLLPDGDAFLNRGDGGKAMGTEFVVIATANQVIDDSDIVTTL